MNESTIQIKKILKKRNLNLGLILFSALIIRIYFGNFELPVLSDSYGYFLFASDISINFQLPNNYSISNTGWPIFLGGLFSIFQFNTVLEYMQMQKIATVILSTLTIIPVYFLCQKFFKEDGKKIVFKQDDRKVYRTLEDLGALDDKFPQREEKLKDLLPPIYKVTKLQTKHS